jgi:hypothetical protein
LEPILGDTHVAAASKPASPTEELLDALVTFLRRYVIAQGTEIDALALWIAHTHAFEAAETTPYLAISSAERECGKTRLLECLEKLVRNPWLSGRVTPPSLYRSTSNGSVPTLLLDEADAAFGSDKTYSETIRGILNSGYRMGGKVSLAVENASDWGKADCSTFFPKAVAGIGEHLHDTTLSRCIPIELRRKLPHEHVQKFRHKVVTQLTEPLREKLAAWAKEWTPRLAEAMPDSPSDLGDRAADIWEPLFAIADLAGPEWTRRARESAVALSASQPKRESTGEALLRDILHCFKEDRMASQDLVRTLAAMEESPWGGRSPDWASEFDARALAKLLKPFGVRPIPMRLSSTKTGNGYKRVDFEDSWARFLPSEEPNNVNQINSMNDRNLADDGPIV